MKQISILGCGWLGFPLAKSLLQKGYLISGSTTSENKIPMLHNAGITPFLICLSEEKLEGEMDYFLKNSEILIIDIPPKLRGNALDTSTALSKTFVKKIQNLIPFIENSSVKKVLFVSSTSVYADENVTITEESITNPDTESGKQLLEAEVLLQSNENFQTTVIRFGGLIGADRHPIQFLSGKTNIENPEAPINLIHQEDCIGIIEKIIQKAQNENYNWNETFNAAAPFHPTRKEYYTQKAIELNLALPHFNESKPSIGKLISCEKVEHILGYSFKNIKL
ncbi:SDR family oxidoreductase [Flavobacterium sp.]|uniref:SDR family oxidoreductase n=1 Tax=Flavobacterium sp. TaxID=239 RepID=UPI0038D22A66